MRVDDSPKFLHLLLSPAALALLTDPAVPTLSLSPMSLCLSASLHLFSFWDTGVDTVRGNRCRIGDTHKGARVKHQYIFSREVFELLLAKSLATDDTHVP